MTAAAAESLPPRLTVVVCAERLVPTAWRRSSLWGRPHRRAAGRCVDANVRVIGLRHECAVTMAAEGFALATGRAGVPRDCGPGFTNALTGSQTPPSGTCR